MKFGFFCGYIIVSALTFLFYLYFAMRSRARIPNPFTMIHRPYYVSAQELIRGQGRASRQSKNHGPLVWHVLAPTLNRDGDPGSTVDLQVVDIQLDSLGHRNAAICNGEVDTPWQRQTILDPILQSLSICNVVATPRVTCQSRTF